MAKHGGKRKGAGRKPSAAKYLGVYVKLPPRLLQWLKDYRKRTTNPINRFIVEAVEQAVRVYEEEESNG